MRGGLSGKISVFFVGCWCVGLCIRFKGFCGFDVILCFVCLWEFVQF